MAPVNEYFKGHGSEVMSNMAKEYGEKKGKSVFYALANKKGQKPASHKNILATGKKGK